ncbi:MAG TPA: response regulator [Terricaulis sp.]|nr:response regulator [Terricaulis sp.]
MQSPLAGLKVLVVEDDVIIAEAALLLLGDLGAEAIGPCASVGAALAALNEHCIDLALLDVDLNGMRSTAVANALAARAIPYVAATGHIIAAAMAGAPVIVQKPYTPARLRAALESVVA